jgi:nicotinamide mononucleotide adenylyltransferase
VPGVHSEEHKGHISLESRAFDNTYVVIVLLGYCNNQGSQ